MQSTSPVSFSYMVDFSFMTIHHGRAAVLNTYKNLVGSNIVGVPELHCTVSQDRETKAKQSPLS